MSAIGTDSGAMSDPRYQEAVGCLQSGDWAGASQRLEDLATQYPDSGAVKRLLAEARFGADLDGAPRSRPKRWIIPWRAIITRGLVVIVIGILAVGAVSLYRDQVRPLLAAAQTGRRQVDMLQRANACMDAGDVECAEDLFTRLLAEVPDHEEAAEHLARIVEDRERSQLFERARALMDTGEYEAAVGKLEELLARAPRYPDARELLIVAERLRDLDGPFALAEAEYEAGHAVEAIARYEQIKAVNANYRRDTIVKRLVELYTALGRELIEAVPPAPDSIPQAVYFFDQALTNDPRASAPATEKELAQLYLEGEQRYGERQWDDAISRLRELHDRRPGYLGNTAVSMLYYAYLEAAVRYRALGDLYLPYEQCRKASELPIEDTSEARRCMADLVGVWTPTPTPSPTPTPTPTPTPEPATPTPTPTIRWIDEGPVTLIPPYAFVADRQLVAGTSEWEGHLGIIYKGGSPPFKFALDNSPPQASNYLYIRWQLCRVIPITVHVWSSNGEAHEKIQLHGWCP